MQMSRLRHTKIALIDRPDNHPLSSANSASYNFNDNSGITSALADFTSQSGGTNGNKFKTAIRFGYETAAVGQLDPIPLLQG